MPICTQSVARLGPVRSGQVGKRQEARGSVHVRSGKPSQQDGLVPASSREHRSQRETLGSAMKDLEEIREEWVFSWDLRVLYICSCLIVGARKAPPLGHPFPLRTENCDAVRIKGVEASLSEVTDKPSVQGILLLGQWPSMTP